MEKKITLLFSQSSHMQIKSTSSWDNMIVRVFFWIFYQNIACQDSWKDIMEIWTGTSEYLRGVRVFLIHQKGCNRPSVIHSTEFILKLSQFYFQISAALLCFWVVGFLFIIALFLVVWIWLIRSPVHRFCFAHLGNCLPTVSFLLKVWHPNFREREWILTLDFEI